MGTVVSIDVRGDVAARTIEDVVAWFHDVDRRFSTYRDDSDVSQITAGTLDSAAYGADLLEVVQLCEQVRRSSDGAFDAWQQRDGNPFFDPSAVVKGWSVDRAAARLEATGLHDFAINAGGDAVVRGAPEPGQRWRVGIRHPHDPQKVAAVIAVTDMAVATSGTYERGEHIVDPRSGEAATGLLSMTVVGPTLALADAYSTAAYVMGIDGAAWIAGLPGHHGYAITRNLRAVYTTGFADLLVDAQPQAATAPA